VTGRTIADALQTGETVVDGAVLAVGFLSTIAAALFLGLVFVFFRFVSRYRRADQARRCARQAFIESPLPPTQPVRQVTPAVLDTRPGTNLAAQDECELIWDMAAREPGPERLWWAVRDEQQRGEQS
jgi:hypothetical protein